MKKVLRKFLFVGLAMVAAGSTLASAGEFNPAQRKEIGEIVREYLLKNPEVLRDAFIELERRSKQAQEDQARSGIVRHADAIFRAGGDLVVGNREGKVAIVEFFDYNCGFCKRSLPDVLKLIKKNKDLRFIFKEFPILGPGSTEAAQLALASRKQGDDKYWEYHVALMKHRGRVDGKVALAIAKKVGLDVEKLEKDAKAPDIVKTIGTNMAIAEALGINGTPAFVIGDELAPGALGYNTLNGILARVREKGCKIC